MGDKITVPDVRARKGGPKLTMVTAYDYPSARMASDAGVDMILVGDSVANVVHGMGDTLGVDIDIMVLHARAVRRADPRPLVIVDMPWLSFHISKEDTLRNAGRLVREGGAEAVKLEGGHRRVPMIDALVGAEIPVMGHLGLTPQSVHAMGGYRVQGREIEAARMLIQEAKELEAAGVFSIVLEGVPDLVARMVTAPDGKVVNAEVLAAVPMENFGEKVADTQKTWTFKPAKGANVAGCRLNSLNHVYKVIFYIG